MVLKKIFSSWWKMLFFFLEKLWIMQENIFIFITKESVLTILKSYWILNLILNLNQRGAFVIWMIMIYYFWVNRCYFSSNSSSAELIWSNIYHQLCSWHYRHIISRKTNFRLILNHGSVSFNKKCHVFWTWLILI